jgi:hypothetical protein
MTQHTDKVEKQRELLKIEALDKKIISIDIRPGRIQTWYQSGRVVTEYPRDKRKKKTTEYRGLND